MAICLKINIASEHLAVVPGRDLEAGPVSQLHIIDGLTSLVATLEPPSFSVKSQLLSLRTYVFITNAVVMGALTKAIPFLLPLKFLGRSAGTGVSAASVSGVSLVSLDSVGGIIQNQRLQDRNQHIMYMHLSSEVDWSASDRSPNGLPK